MLPSILSPGNWPEAERKRLEQLESRTWSPLEAQTVEGSGGMVSATVSPIAVYAAIQALKLGGNAADAAATSALTQVTTQLGSVVSYAGIFAMLYYDAKTRKVHSMDAAYNSYLQETDPKSIPVCGSGLSLGQQLLRRFARKPVAGGASGRQTLVPGFMAGVEAMHGRFGCLPFRDLFEPAVWYAEHGVRISHLLQYCLLFRSKFLSRTPEGQRFLRQVVKEKLKADRGVWQLAMGFLLQMMGKPKAGDLFVQPDLAKTLKAVSEQGSRYMYTGQWGEDFVSIVQREGGKVTLEDLKRYEPVWSEPRRETVFGHTVYVNGPPHRGAYSLFAGLNLAEAMKLDQKSAYWMDPETFRALARIGLFVFGAPWLHRGASNFLSGKGIDISPEAQLGKDYAQAVAPLLEQLYAQAADNAPKHSNAIVVIDKDGNIAAITHSINTLVWGETGIVVGGIPVPDSAGLQQANLATVKPGDRVPHNIIDTIVFEGGTPVLATGSIGGSLVHESIRVLLGVLGQRQSLATVMAAPPLLATFDLRAINKALSHQSVSIPRGAYGKDFIGKVKSLGLKLTKVTAITTEARRGTLAAVAINSRTGKRTAVNQPKVIVFNSAE